MSLHHRMREISQTDYSLGLTPWSPCGTRICTTRHGMVQVFDVATGALLCSMPRNCGDWVTDIAWSPCSSKLAIASPHDGTLRVWHIDTQTLMHAPRTNALFSPLSLLRMAWSPCGTRIAVANHAITVVWSAHTGMIVNVLTTPTPKFAHRHIVDVVWQDNKNNTYDQLMTGQRPNDSKWTSFAAELPTHMARLSTKIILTAYKDNILIVDSIWSPRGDMLAMQSNDNRIYIVDTCKWSPRTHARFTPAARQLVRWILCARNRIRDMPIENWLMIIESVLAF